MNSLSTSSLAYLQASPQKLLELACTLYLCAKPRSYINYMTEGLAIFKGWCVDHPGWSKKDQLLHGYVRTTQSGHITKLIDRYELQQIAMFLKLPNSVVETAMCAAIRMIACQQIT